MQINADVIKWCRYDVNVDTDADTDEDADADTDADADADADTRAYADAMRRWLDADLSDAEADV